MTLKKTEERIPARMPHAVYERIVAAAHTVGATLNQFLVQAAIDKANEILERERIISLSVKDADTLFNLIDNPPEPNDHLKTIMNQRAAHLCQK
jgi:uncharacterized protein (DUF1778 family)